MVLHDFIFKEGLWVGQGKIILTGSLEYLRFYTKWTIEKPANNKMECRQEVEVEAGGSSIQNFFIFSDLKENSFAVELTSEFVGTVKGTGIIDSKMIAWEFRGDSAFEGFEVYELQDNGDFMFHAEYSSTDQLRTVIDGRIWKKS